MFHHSMMLKEVSLPKHCWRVWEKRKKNIFDGLIKWGCSVKAFISHWTVLMTSERYCCSPTRPLKQLPSLPKFVLYQFPSIAVPPKGAVSNPREATVNHVISLHCNVTGEPRPTVRWDGPTGTDLSTSYTLKLNVTSVAFKGVYNCTAENSVGGLTLTTHITQVNGRYELAS